MEGYIKLYRKVMDSPVWDDPNYLKLWMFCLMKATHKEREVLIGNQVITLEPGQFITGRKSLAEDLNKGMKPKFRQSEISWWRYLNNLEKQEMLNIKKTNKYSVVTITKWGDYQINEQQMNNKRTSNEQQMNTNKNVKNDKNVKKEEEVSPFKLFEENICMLNPLNRDSLIDWCEDLGDDLVIAAIKLGAKYNARSYKYVEDIFKEWVQHNIKTVEEARIYVKEKNKRTSNIVDFSSKKKANGVDWGGFDISD
ncbi:DnaD domain-containing protein [Oceanobacillus sp. FSL K6-0251]|uniref:DnaD domain-containing protein n=1 Tax=Oceanobacillus sp. FSL K6-0251 TaxID=2921602 RepID=UPI0030F4B48C